MADSIVGLTEADQKKLDGLLVREKEFEGGNEKKKLTDKMKETKKALIVKQTAIPPLSKGAKSYCLDWYLSKLYDKRKTFKSKYTDKGNKKEDDAIDYMVGVLGLGFAKKNEERFYGEFIHGEPDVLLRDEVLDTKCNWDCYSFPLFQQELKVGHDYWWQLQGYMKITGKKTARLVYLLMDLPDEMVHDLAMKQYKFYNEKEEDYEDIYDALKKEHTYSHLPDYLRVQSYEFDYDEEAGKRVEQRVKMCRDYIANLKGIVDRRKEHFELQEAA